MSGQSTQPKPTPEALVRATVINLLDRALSQGVSAIHFEPRPHVTVVRFRTDGLLSDAGKLPRQHHQAIIDHLKSLATEVDETGISSFRHQVDGTSATIHIAAVPLLDGEKVVLHIMPHVTTAASLASLGFWGDALAKVEHALCQPHGLMLAASPNHRLAGQTLAAMAMAVRSVQRSVIDIEPISQQTIDGINQIQPSWRGQLPERLKWALQQDSDVIIIGNLTDKPTVELVFETALGQRLLLGSLAASSAAQVLRRVLDMGIPPHLVAASLRLVTGQRQVRQLCQQCREAYTPTKTAVRRIAKLIQLPETELFPTIHQLEITAQTSLSPELTDLSSSPTSINRLWRASPVGCQHCQFSGFSKRLALVEVIELTPALQRAVILNQSLSELQAVAQTASQTNLPMDGLIKALRGLTTLEEITATR